MRANEDISDEVKVIQTLEIPPVVDFDDLGDPEKGHLIGEEAKRMLEDVMQDLPPGRYEKIEVRKKLQGKYSQDAIKAAFPHNYVWSMIKDPDNGLHAIYLGEKDEKLLGEGGFGSVKVEWSLKKNDWDVVKVVLHDVSAVEEQKILNELKKNNALVERKRKVQKFTKKKKKKLQHIVPLPEEVTQYNLIMDYVKGVNLYTYLSTYPLSSARLLNIALQIAEQIAELHNRGYLHCDIKPSNIMYEPISGKVTIIDMGLALKIEDKTSVVKDKRARGTEDYDAPELKLKKDLYDYSVKTDAYALGVTLRMVLGFEPFYIYDADVVKKPGYTTAAFRNDDKLNSLLKSMTHPIIDRRTREEVVIDNLKILHNELIPVSPKTTGILNISDYERATQEERLAFFRALCVVDSVILVDNEQRGNVIDYSKIRREIEEDSRALGNTFRLTVDSKIVIAKTPDLAIKKIREQENKLQDRKQQETMISQLCYFHPQGKPVKLEGAGVQSIEVTSATRNYQSEIVNRTTPVSEMHLLEVRNALSDDLIRYMHKHSLKFNGDTGAIEKNDPEKSVSESKIKRIRILQKALNEMEDFRSIKNKNEKINYSTFFAKIDSWQNEIIQAHSKKRQATFMFTFLQPKGLKKMGEVSEKIKTEGPFVPKMRPSK